MVGIGYIYQGMEGKIPRVGQMQIGRECFLGTAEPMFSFEKSQSTGKHGFVLCIMCIVEESTLNLGNGWHAEVETKLY